MCRRIGLLTALALATSTQACAGGKVALSPDRVEASEPGLHTLTALKLVVKKKEFELEFLLENETDQPQILRLSEMACFIGEARGRVQHARFGIGERTIDFAPKQVKNFHLLCLFEEKVSGDVALTTGQIYSNPSADGKTRGEPVSTGFEWRHPAG